MKDSNVTKNLQKKGGELKMKNEKGITLIALIITIIILVILAAVSVRAIYEMGIVNHAVNGTQKYAEEAIKENQMLDRTTTTIDDAVARIKAILGESVTPTTTNISIVQPDLSDITATASVGVETTANSKYTSNGKTAVIPEGFTVSGIQAEQSINGGLVIYDLKGADANATNFWSVDLNSNSIPDVQENYNQFVWIPVDAPYITESQLQTLVSALDTDAIYAEIETQMEANAKDWWSDGNGGVDETSFANDVEMSYQDFLKLTVPQRYQILYFSSLSMEAYAIQSIENSGTYPMAIKLSNGNYRGILYDWNAMWSDDDQCYIWSEPIQVLPFSTTESYDYDGSIMYREPAYLTNNQYADASTYNSIGLTQSILQEEYNAMVESVAKNGGFWVARYELTENSGARSTSTRGQTVASAASTSQNTWYGLYYACRDMYNTTSDAVQSIMISGSQYDQIMIWMAKNGSSSYVVNSTGKGNYSGSPVVSGSSTDYGPNNVFDLAGYLFEWTSEAYNTGNRVMRGGYYSNNGVYYPASSRCSSAPYHDNVYNSSRSTLYVKSAKSAILTNLTTTTAEY